MAGKVKERKLERELLWVVGFLGLLVLIFLISSAYFRSLNTFKYEGLSFTKEKFGELPVYHYAYYFENKASQVVQYNLYLQKDPRDNKIPVSGQDIFFNKRQAWISIDADGISQCPRAFAGVFDLSKFLVDNEVPIKNGVTDYGESIILNQSWVTCENNPNTRIVEITRGNNTEIEIGLNCYRIIVGPECDLFDAVEKFKLQSVIDAKKSE